MKMVKKQKTIQTKTKKLMKRKEIYENGEKNTIKKMRENKKLNKTGKK